MDSRWLMLGSVVIALTAARQPAPKAPLAAAAAPVAVRVAAAAPVTEAPANPSAVMVESAIDSLGRYVTKQSHDDALRMAFTAYYNFKAANASEVRKPYLYFVDYGLDNRTPRGYVFDMEALTLVEGPFLVAHGRGSLSASDGIPTRFSNGFGSSTTSLGLYVAEETYGFSGHAGGQLYHSIGLRMSGKSGSFNSNARARGVVVHGAPYVTAARAGRSQGCPAMDQQRAKRLIPMISEGGVVFLFAPNSAWMTNDPWVSAAAE